MKCNEKLSELLGILQSINYDKVINSMEIEALKQWMNENDSCDDPRFQEIIEKLNKVLEDSKITEEEKNEIIAITDQYYELGNFSQSISELLGIIQGIIADNEINLDEINRLNDWLNKNVQLVGNYFYNRLSSTVKIVLQDGVITEEEKQKLKILLRFLLKDHSLNRKIEILKKMVKNGEVIGNQLIELINDNTVMTKIHREASCELNTLLKRRCTVYDIDSEIIFISLTLIALLKYDGNYYNYVEDTYQELYKKYSKQRIEGQIRDVINRFNDGAKEDHRIISLVLKNAIVPKVFLPSFFDFIFDIYKWNFNYSIDPTLDLNEEFLFAYDGIKKDLNYDEDSLNLKVTNKTYYLIKTTKDLILEENKINDLITLSISVLKMIDHFYWSNSNLEIENEYFQYGFNSWKQKLNKNEKKNENSKERESESEFKSMWEPVYKLDGSQIYLVIPKHKIKSYYDYEKLSVEITNGDAIIYKNDHLNVFDIIGGYRIEIENILIEKPLNKLRYRLLCEDQVIYDSKEKLYRKYIVFNSFGNELKNNKDYEGIAFLCTKDTVSNTQVMFQNENYTLGFIRVNIGDCIKINQDIFNFISIQSPGLIGNEQIGKCYKEEKELSIYKELYGIVYESENPCNQIAIVINGKRSRLSDLEYTEKQHGIYYNYTVVPHLENGFHNVIFEENKNGKYAQTKKFHFLIDSEFIFNSEQTSPTEYFVTIKCLNKTYNKAISFDIEDISLIHFDDISFDIPISIPIFKLNEENWENILNHSIWIKDIYPSSKLKFFGFSFDEICVTDEVNNPLTTLYQTKEKNYLVVFVGTLKSYESHKYVKLDFYEENKKIGFLYCYCECIVNETQSHFWYDEQEKKYKCQISYYGKGTLNVRILNKLENVVEETVIENEKEISFEHLVSFEHYKLQVISKNKGLSFNKEKIIYEREIEFYSIDDFVGKYFPISTVYFDKGIGNILIRKSRNLYRTYVEITKRLDKDLFIGNLYTYKENKKYLDKVNPVEIEFTSSINDGKIEASITQDDDGLLYDFEHNTILNDTELWDAPDIISYIFVVERK